jgi:transcriptional regulator GlxA family with amidase domain
LIALVAAVPLAGAAPATSSDAPRLENIPADEVTDTLAALKPPKRARPVVAVLGLNEGSETTDYLVPYGVIKRSGAADVFALGIKPGPVKLMPTLTIVPDTTAADFDQRFPAGADYVIVPAMHVADDPQILAWIRAQSAHGAIVVGVCAGAIVLANAGVLHDKRATTHWFRVTDLLKADPTIRYTADRRYVVDQRAVTTTGVSASLPVALAIVAAIAGRERADSLAAELGAGAWGAEHDSAQFGMSANVVIAYATNLLAFWRHESVGIPVAGGVDAIALAFTSNAYASTHLGQVRTLAADTAPIVMHQGLRLIPDGRIGEAETAFTLPPLTADAPAAALDRALVDIDARYGARTARVVRLELEYPQANSFAAPAVASIR